MPVSVRKSRRGGYDIVEKSSKVKGHSSTRAKAQASANARNAGRHGWKPTGKPRKR